MALQNTNLFIGVSILFAFLGITVFGLLQFSHVDQTHEAPMINCFYAENGYSICENTLNHINNWRQFSNVIFPSLSIFLLLILGMVFHFFGIRDFLNQEQYFYKRKYYLYDKKLYSFQERIIKWLSLFENSPSLSSKT